MRRMNCREFRHKHDAYVDDTLSGVDLEAMGRHLRLCESCAAMDTRIRRSLLLARNLPTIEPSAAFSERLQMRLAHERALQTRIAREAGYAGMDTSMRHRVPGFTGAYVALAAGIAMAAGLVMSTGLASRSAEAIRLAPVVASLPEPEPSALSMPAMVASMPAGIPVWPAVFVAQQAPWRLASDVLGR
jgi:predicted anti-sigma-YlaC factor YlaD